MTIMAKYSGSCGECGDRWQPGDLICSPESPPPGMPAQWQHAACPDAVAGAFEHHSPVCDRCHISHPAHTRCDEW